MAQREAGEAPANREPLCREPWAHYYILRRGVMPCCYGYAAIAPMKEWETTWNSPALQDIRRHLAQGKLSPYCLLSPSCPIVQRHATPRQLDAAARAYARRKARAAGSIPWLLSFLPARIRTRFSHQPPNDARADPV